MDKTRNDKSRPTGNFQDSSDVVVSGGLFTVSDLNIIGGHYTVNNIGRQHTRNDKSRPTSNFQDSSDVVVSGDLNIIGGHYTVNNISYQHTRNDESSPTGNFFQGASDEVFVALGSDIPGGHYTVNNIVSGGVMNDVNEDYISLGNGGSSNDMTIDEHDIVDDLSERCVIGDSSHSYCSDTGHTYSHDNTSPSYPQSPSLPSHNLLPNNSGYSATAPPSITQLINVGNQTGNTIQGSYNTFVIESIHLHRGRYWTVLLGLTIIFLAILYDAILGTFSYIQGVSQDNNVA